MVEDNNIINDELANDDTKQIVPVININAPKKAGRPFGAKDSTARLSPYARAKAKALWIAGYLPDDICKEIKFDNTEYLKKTAKDNDWNSAREEHLKATTSIILREITESQEESLRDLKTIRQRAIEAIIQKKVNPLRFTEATNAYLASLELEYKLKVEALQVSFLNDVAIVLKNKIQDKLLLSDIAASLRLVFEKYQSRQLPEAKKAGTIEDADS
jgi:hypothetical protein